MPIAQKLREATFQASLEEMENYGPSGFYAKSEYETLVNKHAAETQEFFVKNNVFQVRLYTRLVSRSTFVAAARQYATDFAVATKVYSEQDMVEIFKIVAKWAVKTHSHIHTAAEYKYHICFVFFLGRI